MKPAPPVVQFTFFFVSVVAAMLPLQKLSRRLQSAGRYHRSLQTLSVTKFNLNKDSENHQTDIYC